MTAPVLQSPDNAENAWVVSFVMPRSFDLTLPAPISDIVDVVANPATTMAVIEYKGGEARYQKHEDGAASALATGAYRTCGKPLWARHNPPMTPWFHKTKSWCLCAPGTPRRASSALSPGNSFSVKA